MQRETEIRMLHEELLSGSYTPGHYRFFTIHEPKCREIAAAPFRDRVVHHALCNYLAPVLEHRFIARSFSCQAGKGTTAARECCRKLTNRYQYVLKCDVRKFYASLDHDILFAKLERWIDDPRILEIIRKILKSFHENCNRAVYFPDDDLFSPFYRYRGLPIGNLTSQLWGNFYLSEMDHRITSMEEHGAYLRYTDDFLLFSNSKDRLWRLREIVIEELAVLRLKLAEPKSRMLASKEGVPFCGFRFLPGLRPHILGNTKRRFEKRRHMLHRNGEDWSKISESVFSWYQFSREANSQGLRIAYANWPFDGKKRQRRRKRGGAACFAGRFLEQQQSQEFAVLEPQQQSSRQS